MVYFFNGSIHTKARQGKMHAKQKNIIFSSQRKFRFGFFGGTCLVSKNTNRDGEGMRPGLAFELFYTAFSDFPDFVEVQGDVVFGDPVF